MRNFEGRTAVITGGAGGFGLEFARRAVALGMQVVLADVEQQALERAVAELRVDGASVLALQTDVSDARQVDRLADLAFERCGGVHLLFNNAGVAPVGLLWEQSESDWQWVLGVNVMGVANGIRSFVPRMLAQRDDSHVVNTASVAGFISPTTMGLYNASKHAVVTISETLFHDLRSVESTIGVTVLCPAFVATGISSSDRNRPERLAEVDPPSPSTIRAREAMKRAVSSGKLTAAEIADRTFEAIRERRFYLFTHPAILSSVRGRHQSIVDGLPPDDPFGQRPGLAPSPARRDRRGEDRGDEAGTDAAPATDAAPDAIQRPGRPSSECASIRTPSGGAFSVELRCGSWTELRPYAQPIRFQVFVDEQGIDPALELDDNDDACLHCVAWVEGVVAGTGRLLPDGHIGRMAVTPDHRRSGLGGLILECLVAKARERGDRRVGLSAQAYVESFYERHGFVREGSVYQEAGIDHISMWREL